MEWILPLLETEVGITTYDEKGKKIATIAVSSTGEFKNAAGTSINFVNESWIYTYDKNGKKTGTRPNR